MTYRDVIRVADLKTRPERFDRARRQAGAEDGQIVAPLNVMRFDETLFRMLGDNLVGLTRDRELIMANGTYGGRTQVSWRLPGALIDDFTLTL